MSFTLAGASAGFTDSCLEQAAPHDFWYRIAYEGILALHDVKRDPVTVPLTGAIDAPTYRVHFTHGHLNHVSHQDRAVPLHPRLRH